MRGAPDSSVEGKPRFPSGNPWYSAAVFQWQLVHYQPARAPRGSRFNFTASRCIYYPCGA